MAKQKYDPNTFPLLAEQYAREGLIDTEIAEKLGISTASFYLYQNKNLEFLEAIKRGKAPVDVRVENALLKRAEGFTYEEVIKELLIQEDGTAKVKSIRTVKKVIPPETGAIAFWLKNRQSAKWRDRANLDIEHELTTDQPIQVIFQKGG